MLGVGDVTRDQIFIFEPMGDRALSAPIRVGSATDCDVRIPDDETDRELIIDRDSEGWFILITADGANLNGVPLQRDWRYQLQTEDVLRIGDAVLRVRLLETDLELLIDHPEGNATLAPSAPVSLLQYDEQAEERISAAPREFSKSIPSDDTGYRVNRKFVWGSLFGLVAILLLVVTILGRLQPVTFVVDPTTASVGGSGLGWTSGNTLFLMPGERTILASAKGYSSLQQRVSIKPDEPMSLQLRLEPLPGIVEVDTAGVAAEVFVDGARTGKVPGDLEILQGMRTLTIRADKYFDEIRQLEVEGFGVRQVISVPLRPSWGTVQVQTDRAAATLIIEGQDPIPLPAEVQLPAGLHRLEVAAPEAKSWRGAVLVEAGVVQTIGPLSLGEPDAIWQISSRPSGASVTVNGVFRGRTPLEVTLTPQMEHQITVGEQGYSQVERRVRPTPAERQTLQLNLDVRRVTLTVEGEPIGAEIFLAGRKLGVSPLEVELPARRAQLSIRQQGFTEQSLSVDLSSGVARQVTYRLVPEGRSADWQPPAAQVSLVQGPVLRLIQGGSFTMGSARREQGRRSNEWQRRVTLQRPFYMGTREISNGEFRRFRADHASGFIGKRSLDLDSQSVTGISWEDAVEYCNWLSAQNGLTPAYTKKKGRWTLVQPVNTGFRLPTEAEWEFVTRVEPDAAPVRRYPWGMQLPPPIATANLAGEEAAADLSRTLSGWRDEYVVVAPSAQHPANTRGLYDLLGNVSEWVHDAYATVPEGEPLDPIGPTIDTRLRVIKGANWRTSQFADLRAAWRDGRDRPADDVGFRIARYAEE